MSHVLHSVRDAKGLEGLGHRDLRGEVALVAQHRDGQRNYMSPEVGREELEGRVGVGIQTEEEKAGPAPVLLATCLPLEAVLVFIPTPSPENRRWLFSLCHFRRCVCSPALLQAPGLPRCVPVSVCMFYESLRFKWCLTLNFWFLSTSQLFSRTP